MEYKNIRGGNLDPSLNPNYCHNEISQCQDAYSSCGGGNLYNNKERELKKKYKYFKNKYKSLKNNNHNNNDY